MWKHQRDTWKHLHPAISGRQTPHSNRCCLILPADAVAPMLPVHFTDIWRPGPACRSRHVGGARLLGLAKVMGDIVYVIGPTPAESRQIANALASEPITVVTYDSAELFLNQVTATTSGCVLVPSDLSGMGVRALISEILRRRLPLAIVVMGRRADLPIAVELVRAGATDFLEQPFSHRQLRLMVRRAIGTSE